MVSMIITVTNAMFIWSGFVNTKTYSIPNCQKTAYFNSNFIDRGKHLYTVIFILKELTYTEQHFFSSWEPRISKEYLLSSHGMNYLIYRFSSKCNVDASDLFLDVLLNSSLNSGRPFKIYAIIAIVREDDLIKLANIMAPYCIPIISFPYMDFTRVKYSLSSHRYFENVIFLQSRKNSFTDDVLAFVTKNFQVKIVTILFNNADDIAFEAVKMFTKILERNSVCVNHRIIKLDRGIKERSLEILLESARSNVFLMIANKAFDYGSKLIDVFNNRSHTNSFIIMYIVENYNIRKSAKSHFQNLNPKVELLVIFEESSAHYGSFLFYSLNALSNAFGGISRGILMDKSWDSPFVRNLPCKSSEMLIFIIKYFWRVDLHYFVDKSVFARYFRKRNSRFEDILLFSIFPRYDGTHKFLKRVSKNYTDVVSISPICEKTCGPGFTPAYIIETCCWKCVSCWSGYVKKSAGQTNCKKCKDSIPNVNNTQCLPYSNNYFTTTQQVKMLVILLASLSSLYMLCFLLVFLYYRNTPLVKSSNLTLSLIQILVHLMMNGHFVLTKLQQKCSLYLWHTILGGYALKIIMSIYLIKMHQLITIFKSQVVIEKTIIITAKELILPALYMSVNFLITGILLETFRFEYRILEIQASLLRYRYCNIDNFLYFDIISLTTFSIICCIQAFRARKLPANYNETYYVFVGMFTTALLFLVLIPLNASFDKDGRKMFASSAITYCTNIALISITYGYKIVIMIFQKEKNTAEVFQKILLKHMREKVKKKTPSENKETAC